MEHEYLKRNCVSYQKYSVVTLRNPSPKLLESFAFNLKSKKIWILPDALRHTRACLKMLKMLKFYVYCDNDIRKAYLWTINGESQIIT